MNFKSFRKVLSLFLYQAYEKKRIKQICTVLGVLSTFQFPHYNVIIEESSREELSKADAFASPSFTE